ncbi:Hypothetical predicted protein [Mytilus galloprovincialis]|uniref:Uncharacterized protein n=1 Tax=Mytilus galloprovincialis TaxID=29158 RepID=A0A8B6FE62_MYTGA|nr:Hypothetical predicted protein [Mytilus galloprovincialis]
METTLTFDIFLIASIIILNCFGDVTTVGCDKVCWTVQQKTLVFGTDVKLVCKTSDDTDLCTNCTKIWTGGHVQSLLSLNGYPSSESSKYWPTIGKDEFVITIKTFNKQDLNQEYSCTIGPGTCRRNLTDDMFDSNKREVSLDETTASYDTSNNISHTALICLLVILFFVFGILSCIYISVKCQEKEKFLTFCITCDIQGFLLLIKMAPGTSNTEQDIESSGEESGQPLNKSPDNVLTGDD